MKTSETVFKVFDEIGKDDFKERIIQIESTKKEQSLIYCYNKLSFRAGFLKK